MLVYLSCVIAHRMQGFMTHQPGVVTEFGSHDDVCESGGVAFSFAALAQNQIIEFTD